MTPKVDGFFDPATNSISYLVSDPATRRAAAIDPVLDFDPASGRTGTGCADTLIAAVERDGLAVDWILETHVHADHITAAPYIQERLGGRTGIGAGVLEVQRTFGALFNIGDELAGESAHFDRLFEDGDTVPVGGIDGRVMSTPGHTPACACYVFGDAAFVGDTMFMPDSGTARADFPGGSAETLYDSLRRILSLPAETRLFMCHDYGAGGTRDFAWETTVAEQRRSNIHCRDGVSRESYVAARTARDAELSLPRLIVPAVQVNIRGGRMPPPESNGTSYLKVPVDTL
ncbi:MAG: MBL fold metallo-hydrolase [Defluviicoccus sp.]|nr:MBL fold metallo-hydrolase [Defluviicoccus sp.]MDE0277803.1 MBL fold metallo-hydrolase [Defluviicoccus sp.]